MSTTQTLLLGATAGLTIYLGLPMARVRGLPKQVGSALNAVATLPTGRRLARLIATGIGLHNFGEGLAIGQSAAAGELSLALVLIIGFGLHNATEGFGIIGPMVTEPDPPSWAFLGLMGLIGG